MPVGPPERKNMKRNCERNYIEKEYEEITNLFIK